MIHTVTNRYIRLTKLINRILTYTCIYQHILSIPTYTILYIYARRWSNQTTNTYNILTWYVHILAVWTSKKQYVLFETIPLGVCIWYVFASILFVSCSYLVSIMFVYCSICTYCTYMHITMRLAIFRAFYTSVYVQYVQILTWIRAYTYTKYVPNTCKYISSYVNVTSGICMYMAVYECMIPADTCRYWHDTSRYLQIPTFHTCRYLHYILRNFLEYLHIHADTDISYLDIFCVIF